MNQWSWQRHAAHRFRIEQCSNWRHDLRDAIVEVDSVDVGERQPVILLGAARGWERREMVGIDGRKSSRRTCHPCTKRLHTLEMMQLVVTKVKHN